MKKVRGHTIAGVHQIREFYVMKAESMAISNAILISGIMCDYCSLIIDTESLERYNKKLE